MSSRSALMPDDYAAFKAAIHDLSNSAGAVLANWFVVKDYLAAEPEALVIAADIDTAADRLVADIRELCRVLERLPKVSPPSV